MNKKLVVVVALLIITFTGCSVYKTYVNLTRLKFKLADVNNFSLNGVNLSAKKSMNDFTAMELLNFTQAFSKGTLPISFTLNVDALNPNDGSGGYPKTNATIKSFPWRLLIDEKETISGNIGAPVSVPGTGEKTAIPITISLDLVQFLKDKGYDSIINLALQIGGQGGSAAKLALLVQPTVSSPLGDITYPNEIKVIDLEFRDK